MTNPAIDSEYVFSAGPDHDSYVVTTPWSREGVALALSEGVWLAPGVLHGAMLMILNAPEGLLDSMIVSTDGTGRELSLRSLKASLDNWTAFDKMERDWEERNSEPPSVDW